MFAGAVVVIYNVAGIGQLVLTRQLTYDIFVGAVTSWWAPAGLPACCAFAPLRFALCSFAFLPLLLRVSRFSPVPGTAPARGISVAVEIDSPRFCRKDSMSCASVWDAAGSGRLRSRDPTTVNLVNLVCEPVNFVFEPVNFVCGPSLHSPGLYQVRPRHSSRPVVGDRGGKRRDFLQPAQRRRHPYCPWVRCRAQYCAIDGAAPYTR